MHFRYRQAITTGLAYLDTLHLDCHLGSSLLFHCGFGIDVAGSVVGLVVVVFPRLGVGFGAHGGEVAIEVSVVLVVTVDGEEETALLLLFSTADILGPAIFSTTLSLGFNFSFGRLGRLGVLGPGPGEVSGSHRQGCLYFHLQRIKVGAVKVSLGSLGFRHRRKSNEGETAELAVRGVGELQVGDGGGEGGAGGEVFAEHVGGAVFGKVLDDDSGR